MNNKYGIYSKILEESAAVRERHGCCGGSLSMQCTALLNTSYIGPFFNGAIAQWARPGGDTQIAEHRAAHFLFSNNVNGMSHGMRRRNCTTEHSIDIHSMAGPANIAGLRKRDARVLARLTSAVPQRVCIDVLNYRGNGPEDARVLPLSPSRAAFIYVDYAPATDSFIPASGYHRRMHVRVLDLSNKAVQLGPVLRLEPASAEISNLSTIEKNWVPFALPDAAATDEFYVHQWLDDGHGRSVAFRVDLRTGLLLERHVSVARGGGGALRRAMRAAATYADVSGGTPALALNATTMLAVGHTMTWTCNRPDIRAKGSLARTRCMQRNRWRSYSMFAYMFAAKPPFALLATSREFRISRRSGARRLASSLIATASHHATSHGPSHASAATSAATSTSPSVRPAAKTSGDAAASTGDAGQTGGDASLPELPEGLLPSPAPVRLVRTRLTGAEGKAQFPIGLMWLGKRCVVLSWGHDDRETFVTTFPLDVLLGSRMAWRAL